MQFLKTIFILPLQSGNTFSIASIAGYLQFSVSGRAPHIPVYSSSKLRESVLADKRITITSRKTPLILLWVLTISRSSPYSRLTMSFKTLANPFLPTPVTGKDPYDRAHLGAILDCVTLEKKHLKLSPSTHGPNTTHPPTPATCGVIRYCCPGIKAARGTLTTANGLNSSIMMAVG